MKSLSLLLYFSLLLTAVSAQSNASEHVQANDVYIVYMGGKNSANVRTRDDHSQLVSSLSRRNAVVHVYKHGFLGFAARLSKEEADLISQKPSVVSVFPNQIAQLQTTRSWSFLKYQTVQRKMFGSMPTYRSPTKGSDTVIGILDSGIWPESESFDDKSMGPIPKWWKGTCMEGANFTTANCNRKIVGARWYGSQITSTRDSHGHGTHVSSTAAGVTVHNASYYGLARGTTIGGSPGARIAMYTVCSDGCAGADILAGVDDAIADGVDILSLSLGYGYSRDFLEDSIAIGTFHAMENGILVVCAGGNSGPGNGSVVNDAPWIFTVAASTIDRDLQSNVVLGDKKLVKGGGLNFSSLKKFPIYNLKYDNIANGTTNSTYAGRNCHPEQLDKNKVKGNIILCNHDDDNEDYSISSKTYAIKQLGGLGAIFIDDDNRVGPFNFLDYPMTSVSSTDGKEIISYIKSARKPTATILRTKAVLNHKPAPIIPKFSGRGPSSIVKNLLKPDITAPGVNIIAAWRENDKEMTLPGRESPVFSIISGTSMATPHISGIAALVKSHHPAWSPSAIRSAIMTTAFQTNNVGAPITTTFEKAATPYDYGAGEVSNIEPLQPGLVYETETTDYLYFLCNYGYNLTTIKRIASKLPEGFSCSKDSSVELIANLNYPSILISGLTGSRTVTRTVTNVGQEEATYIAKIDAPSSLLDLKVVPDKLHFTKKNKKLSYTVTLTSHLSEPSEDIFGSITWNNGKIKVRSPIVVSKKDENFFRDIHDEQSCSNV